MLQWRSMIWIGLIALALLGLTLAVVGLLLTADFLSLRELMIEHGPRSLGRLIERARARMPHSSAQLIEFVGALVGLTLLVASLLWLRPRNTGDVA
jgi:hypothetical protein